MFFTFPLKNTNISVLAFGNIIDFLRAKLGPKYNGMIMLKNDFPKLLITDTSARTARGTRVCECTNQLCA